MYGAGHSTWLLEVRRVTDTGTRRHVGIVGLGLITSRVDLEIDIDNYWNTYLYCIKYFGNDKISPCDLHNLYK